MAAHPARAGDRDPPPGLLGWLAGAVILAGMMGSLAQQFIDAILGNPAMAEALGVSSGQPTDGIVALTQLYIAIIATGYAVQAVGACAARRPPAARGPAVRHPVPDAWLAAHALVIVVGLVVIVVVSSVVLAAGTAWSMGTAADLVAPGRGRPPCRPSSSWAVWPSRSSASAEGFPVAWAAVALVAFIAFLGPGSSCPSGCSTSPRRPMSATRRWAPSRRCRSSSSAPSPRSSASPRRSASAVEGCRSTDGPRGSNQEHDPAGHAGLGFRTPSRAAAHPRDRRRTGCRSRSACSSGTPWASSSAKQLEAETGLAANAHPDDALTQAGDRPG